MKRATRIVKYEQLLVVRDHLKSGYPPNNFLQLLIKNCRYNTANNENSALIIIISCVYNYYSGFMCVK